VIFFHFLRCDPSFFFIMPKETPKGTPKETTPRRETRQTSSSGPSLQELKSLIESVRADVSSVRDDVIKAMRNEIDSLKTTITSLRLQVQDLESKNQSLKEKYETVDAKLTTLKTGQFREVSDLSSELDDRMRRRLSLIISGLPESSSDSSSQSPAETDRRKCLDVLKLVGTDHDALDEVIRLGQPRKDRPRLLKVKCKSEAIRDAVLRNTKKLRNIPELRRVFINPDRTPMQQNFWKDTLAELKNRRAQGENVVIFRDRVVTRRDAKN
jgi:predicted RNase H-like nuclease (RuvC/YqgF family)